MRHLVPFRVYESKTTDGLTSEQENFLYRCTKGKWSVNPTTGLVDIQGSFHINDRGAKSFFGVKFGNVTKDFACDDNQLQSLEGAPQEVVGNFSCSNNQLQSLAGAPQKVGWHFDCSYNNLQSLEGAPQEVVGSFDCSRNKLKSLAGAPQKVDGDFDCSGNQLEFLEGAPREVGGNFYCEDNFPRSLEGAPKQINGEFVCDEFQLREGEWNMEGWLEFLENESEDAKELILTLPSFNPTYWNSRISENPESTILQLSEFWDDMPDDFRNSIRIPSDLRNDFDNLLELVRSGIM